MGNPVQKCAVHREAKLSKADRLIHRSFAFGSAREIAPLQIIERQLSRDESLAGCCAGESCKGPRHRPGITARRARKQITFSGGVDFSRA